MKLAKRTSSLLLIVFLFTILLTSCVEQSANPNPDSANPGNSKEATGDKVLVIAYDKDAETLDHFKTGWYSDALIYIHDRLITRDYDYNYVPGLAEKWDTSEDGLTWTFFLKEGVKFHDGKPFTAHDVKWTLDTITDPETASPAQSDFAAIKETNVVDDHTVDVVLHTPFPNLLFILSNTASGIASKEAYEKYGDEYGSKYVIGTGPYMFKEWIPGDKLVLEKNPDYQWGPEWMDDDGAPIIDEIMLRIIPEETSRLMELETGNVHILRSLTATMLTSLEESDDIEIFTDDSTKLGYLAYACDKEPFTDIRVRRALNHALNKEEIVKYVFRDTAKPAYGYLPPMLTDEYYADSEKDSYEYDVDKAKDLLKEAGHGNGLELTLAAENSSEYSRLAEVLQAQLKVVGVEVEIQLYDNASYTAMLKDGDQELFLREYSWPNADILDWFLLSSQAPYPNHSRWQDEVTDELINKAVSVSTWEERAVGYHEVQKHLIEQAVWAPIYIPDSSIAVRDEVQNFKFHPWIPQYNDGMDLNIE